MLADVRLVQTGKDTIGPLANKEDDSTVVSFFRNDAEGVLALENDPMVIKVQIRDWSVKGVMEDLGTTPAHSFPFLKARNSLILIFIYYMF